MPTGDGYAEIAVCVRWSGCGDSRPRKLTFPYWLLSSLTAGALQALKLLKEYLPASYHEGSKNPVARERVHSAATIAGIAFANAFLGVCHSMAHKLGSQFHIPHGLANALLICNVIRYNANDNPTKQTAFSQYDRPQARRRYAEIADHWASPHRGDRTAAKIEKLLAWLESIKAELGIPKSIREAGVQEADFRPTLINCLKMHSMTSAPALTRATR